jgi:hypothetical protein
MEVALNPRITNTNPDEREIWFLLMIERLVIRFENFK